MYRLGLVDIGMAIVVVVVVIEDAWRRHTAAPFGFGFGIFGRDYTKTYIIKKKNIMKSMSQNHTKHGPEIVKNRAPRVQKS